MKLDKKCREDESFSIVQRQEFGKRFRILNPSLMQISIYKVDGCLILDEAKKCDFLFIVGEDVRLYMVEMKGVDHVKAVRQIIAAAELLGVSSFTGVKHSAIVSSPCPKAATTYQSELAKLNPRFKKIGLSLPVRKNNIVEVTV
jgi:hypothetical protein